MMFKSIVYLFLITPLCRAAPAKLGITLGGSDGSLPTLTLPYATYRATKYNPNGDVCAILERPFAEEILSFSKHINVNEV